MGSILDYIPQVDIPENKIGDWEIKKFKVQEKDALLQCFSSMKDGRYVEAGKYTKLTYKGKIIMSDTFNEREDGWYFVKEARGKILIAGLGLGVILNALCLKKEVEKCIVVEKEKEVILLVGEYYNNKYPNKITFVHKDIFDYKPEKEEYFDFAWYDIWANLCTDNLEEMKRLHRKFGKKVRVQMSWCRDILKLKKKEEKRGRYLYGGF